VAAEAQVRTFEGHCDRVRSGRINPASADLFFTGSYDHTVRLWDAGSPRSVMTLRHAAPVEDLVLLPSGSMLATASANTITVWDLLSGGRVLQTLCAHSKTVTALCTDGSGEHLLSASLDRMVKVHELGGYRVVGSTKCAAPITSMALAPTGTHLACGLTDSSLVVRKRRSAAAAVAAAASARADDVDALRLAGGAPGQVAQPAVPLSARHLGANPATYRYFLRGRKHSRQPDDELAQSDSLRRLSAFDGALKGFRYHEALDAACANGAPEVILRVVEELVQRNGLRIALQGRDQHTLQPIIAFLVRNVTRPPFAPVLIELASLLLDMYATEIGRAPAVDELFVKLRHTLEAETRVQAELAQLLGAMEVLLAAP
jgi:U3 small nucleolar RNA-associated protein 15